MRASVISIGHELLMGKTLNRHLVTIARSLKGIGISIDHAYIIKDDPSAIKAELSHIHDDVLIFTGGLGPTPDDLTKETVCDFFQMPLVLHEPSLEAIKAQFKRYEKPMSDSNLKQAYFPSQATVLGNPQGTAPGAIFKTPTDQWVVLLPGPPVELNPMLPKVKDFFQTTFNETMYEDGFLVAGIGESEMEERLKGLYAQFPDVYIAPYAGNGEIQYFFTASDQTQLKKAMQAFKKRAEDYIVGPYQTTFEALLIKRLSDLNETIAVAESMTAGMVSARLTDIPGASKVLKESIIVYSDASKIKYLGIDPKLLEEKTAVSLEVATAMVEGLHAQTGADLCGAITGYAGPGADKDSPVGTVFMAVKYQGITTTRKVTLQGNRSFIRERTTAYLLHMLLKRVMDHGRND